MAERTRREQLLTFLLTPAVVLGVVALAVITFRTTFQIERLRQQSVLEATVSVANEKADRLDKRIIEEDNVVVAEADVTSLGSLARRWLPTASRETPTVRAVMILHAEGDHDVYDFATQNPGPEDEAFRRLLIHRMLPLLELNRAPIEELRHLHKTIDGRSYLISYWQKSHGGRNFVVVAWHDVPRIVHDLFPRMLDDTTGHARVHVVDEEGRTVYGQPTPGGIFTVGRPFETTLYGWHLYATLTTAEELSESVERRRELEMVTVAASFLVVAAGVIIVVVAAERERRLAALKSEFVANVSHELKTPLSLVRMFSELLATGRVRDDGKRQQYLSIIMRESERLSALIENVLDFARVERGKAAYHFEPGDVSEVVLRAVEVYRYRMEREGVELALSIEPNLPKTVLDERALELALVNLLDNAIKYGQEGGRIELNVRMRGVRTLEIRLTDHGQGIPKEEQRRIFERFVRGKGAREGRVRGSGIGLALVQHIARSHGGQVWVESDVGKGASFFFTLPVRRMKGSEKPGDDSGKASSDEAQVG
jgi:two-component system phosphate regulon sensor histidine kinase PhoR